MRSTTDPSTVPATPEPLGGPLSTGRDTVEPADWAGGLPQVHGTAPYVRVGHRWFNLLWLLPVGAVLGVVAVAVAQGLRTLEPVESFIAQHPGSSPPAEPLYSGFPAWLRWQHFFNLFFLMFIVRAGLQILADHPRLYWNRHSTPDTEWFRFQKPVPKGRLWTAKDDSVTLPGWFGLPGIRHSIGLARWWHLGFDTLWVVNGIVFYALLLWTGQWQRIVPTSWDVVPDAISAAIQYLSLDFPANQGWVAYNGLQQLAYFGTVFIAAPLAVATGFMQSPAVANRLDRTGRIMNRQAARSIHCFVLVWMVGFIIIHTVLVWITGLLPNLNHITTGESGASWTGLAVYVLMMLVVAIAWFAATPFTLRHPGVVRRVGRALVGPLMRSMEHLDPRPGEYTERDISPRLWPNGTMPASAEYAALAADDFRDYRLRIGGLVEQPVELSLDQIRSLPSQEQITQHFCIQGWSGVARWRGVPMRAILDLVRPLPSARFVAFYSLAEGSDGGTYYDVHSMEGMRHELALLAYDMNGEPLSIIHGAPLRLRNEIELAFKMVKWIEAIELVADYAHLGGGEGGYNEDHEFFGYRDPI